LATGIPETFEDHIQLMFDLQVLAYQADITRVISFLIGRELSTRTYPAIGINEAHHSLSHHQNEGEKITKPARALSICKRRSETPAENQANGKPSMFWRA
jgi:hypothetical protein